MTAFSVGDFVYSSATGERVEVTAVASDSFGIWWDKTEARWRAKVNDVEVEGAEAARILDVFGMAIGPRLLAAVAELAKRDDLPPSADGTAGARASRPKDGGASQ